MPSFVTVRRIALMVALPLGLAACGGSTIQSASLEPENIFQRYSAHYDKVANKTSVQADFFENSPSGVSLELTGGSKVTDNGRALVRPGDFAPLYGTSFEGFAGKHSFMFVHRDGMEETNAVQMRPIAPDPGPKLRLGLLAAELFSRAPVIGAIRNLLETETVPFDAEKYTFNWSGLPVGPSESVYLIVENSTGRVELPKKLPSANTGPEKGPVQPAPTVLSEVTRTAKHFEITTPGAIGITLQKKDLESVGSGKRTIKFERVTRRDLKTRLDGMPGDAKLRGTLTASYMSETRPIVFGKKPEAPKP